MTASPTPWTAERAVAPELARSLIATCIPDLAAALIEPYGDGWDNTAFLVDGTWVFRFPRRELAVALMETEVAALPVLAPALPLPVPVPVYVGRPRRGEDYPWPFAGYRELPGRPAARAALDEGTRTRAAVPLARFLRALHAFPPERLAPCGVAPDALGRVDLARSVPLAEERLAAVIDLGLVEDAGPLERVLAAVPADWTPRTDTVAHGDLDARHVLVGAEGAPCGVIDWGDLHLGDPAVDLALAHGFLPRSAHERFREAYGEVDEDTWRIARFRALFTALVVVVYAQDVGDRAILREALTGLAHVTG